EDLDEQLARENQGLGSPSVTAAHFLQDRLVRSSERMGRPSGSGAEEQQERASSAVSTATHLIKNDRASDILDPGWMNALERRRLEFELGPGGDHDLPYRFALPCSMPQVLAWMRLLSRVSRGELEP